MPEVITSLRVVKARKNHICNYCECRIHKGHLYHNSILKYDTIYQWKEHLYCTKIADKLKMFDRCSEEGLTGEDFQEIITESYQNIMQEKFKECYENENFRLPAFSEQLRLVCRVVL